MNRKIKNKIFWNIYMTDFCNDKTIYLFFFSIGFVLNFCVLLTFMMKSDYTLYFKFSVAIVFSFSYFLFNCGLPMCFRWNFQGKTYMYDDNKEDQDQLLRNSIDIQNQDSDSDSEK